MIILQCTSLLLLRLSTYWYVCARMRVQCFQMLKSHNMESHESATYFRAKRQYRRRPFTSHFRACSRHYEENNIILNNNNNNKKSWLMICEWWLELLFKTTIDMKTRSLYFNNVILDFLQIIFNNGQYKYTFLFILCHKYIFTNIITINRIHTYQKLSM